MESEPHKINVGLIGRSGKKSLPYFVIYSPFRREYVFVEVCDVSIEIVLAFSYLSSITLNRILFFKPSTTTP